MRRAFKLQLQDAIPRLHFLFPHRHHCPDCGEQFWCRGGKYPACQGHQDHRRPAVDVEHKCPKALDWYGGMDFGYASKAVVTINGVTYSGSTLTGQRFNNTFIPSRVLREPPPPKPLFISHRARPIGQTAALADELIAELASYDPHAKAAVTIRAKHPGPTSPKPSPWDSPPMGFQCRSTLRPTPPKTNFGTVVPSSDFPKSKPTKLAHPNHSTPQPYIPPQNEHGTKSTPTSDTTAPHYLQLLQSPNPKDLPSRGPHNRRSHYKDQQTRHTRRPNTRRR